MLQKKPLADDVWDRLKAWSTSYAESGKRLPDDDECACEARRIIVEVFGTDLRDEAQEFYAAEARMMVADIRKQRDR